MLGQIYRKVAKKANYFVSKLFRKKETVCVKSVDFFAFVQQFVATERENVLLHKALLDAQKKIEKNKRNRN